MMRHELKLQPKYYDFILSGTKRIEIRLFDAKRQRIQIGDTIKFLKEPELDEAFDAKVIGLLRYGNFKDLLGDFDIAVLADRSVTKAELLNDLECFYPEDKQERCGVVGIRVELIK